MKVTTGTWRLALFVAAIFALMVWVIFQARNRAVRDVDSLVANGRLYALDTGEREALETQVSALLNAAGIKKPVRINTRYQTGSLNVYVTVPDQSNPSVAKGNSAFVSGKDILLIDNAHFLLGERRIFDRASDEAEEALFGALRAYTVFVLAHELCHRPTHQRPSFLRSDPEEEYAADACAVTLLNSLYGPGKFPWNATVSENAQASSDDIPHLESVSPYFKDLLNALNFIATDLLDNTFSVVSVGEAHPIFFERMQRILDQMEKLFAGHESPLGAQSIKVTHAVMKSASNVLALRPSTVEFDSPIDYALLSPLELIYFDRGNPIPHRIAFRQLTPLGVLRIHNRASQAEPQIRYAWLNVDGTIGMLRTDRNLATVATDTGRVIATRSVANEFGDNSCVKRAEIPRAPVKQVYFMYCVSGSPMARVLNRESLGEEISLNELVRIALARYTETSQRLDFNVFQVSLGSKGDVGVFVRQTEKVYLVECDSNLTPKSVVLLAAEPPLTSDDRIGRARLNLQSWQYLGADQSLAFSGSWLLRKMRAELVSSSPTTPFAASDLTPDLNDDRTDAPIMIVSYQYLKAEMTVVNFREGGVYLLDLSSHTLLPISYFSHTRMEQVQGNDSGYWDIYQKHGQRILLFRSEGNSP